MGLSNTLSDAPSDSIPILLVVAAGGWISYIRSLFHFILHALGFFSGNAAVPILTAASRSGGLASLIALAETLNSSRPFSYDASGEDCLVCLCGLASGDRLRRLACGHVFHCDCLDEWLDEMNLSCPLCRSPLATERRDDDNARAAAELVSWLSPYH
ncbi:hypothetical protein J5N97_004081 [Dioscorea zingiberensis]|uniref:RING-type domain-containing protein n=1 Tax=Dioscorea zingiberensis TaxID=325984 RepID=A0A9D5HQL3_9LILI|nr:hypothetical protein J5N97_004081 [Dioscorea zingiberensis]